MINIYTGTPGSGKSLHLARDCMDYLSLGKSVICNFPVNMDILKKQKRSLLGIIFNRARSIGNYIFKYNEDLTVDYLVQYAMNNHVKRKENQTLIAIDECQVLFNSREFYKSDRLKWIYFFAEHRKLGYSIILVTQSVRMIDRQIRSLIENEIKHRLVNNYKIGFLMPKKTFVAVKYWIGVREKLGTEFFVYSKTCGSFFDSYALLGSLK